MPRANSLKAKPNSPDDGKKTRISKVAQCIRKTVNTVRLRPMLMPDHKSFDASKLSEEMSEVYNHYK